MSVALPVLEIIAIEVLVGVANPQSWGEGGRRGLGMVSFERAFVTSYRPSTVTFRLSFKRFRDIADFVLQHATFSYSTSNLPQISPCSPRWMALGLQRAKVLG